MPITYQRQQVSHFSNPVLCRRLSMSSTEKEDYVKEELFKIQ